MHIRHSFNLQNRQFILSGGILIISFLGIIIYVVSVTGKNKKGKLT
jgi:hypothetical protein